MCCVMAVLQKEFSFYNVPKLVQLCIVGSAGWEPDYIIASVFSFQ